MTKTYVKPAGSVAASTAYTNHTYFDLPEAIEKLDDPLLRGRILNNLAWRLDGLLTQQVSAMYRLMAQELRDTNTIDQLNEAAAILGEQSFAEENFAQIGSNTEGPLTTFHQLLDVREGVYALAGKYAEDIDEFWRAQNVGLEARLREIRGDEPSRAVKNRIEEEVDAIIAHRQKRGKPVNPGYREALIKEALKDETESNKSLNERNKETIDARMNILSLMLAERPTSATEVKHFYELPIATQRALIDSAIQAAERCRKDARRDPNVVFSLFLAEYLDLIDLLTAVTKTDRFRELDETPQRMETRQEPTPVKVNDLRQHDPNHLRTVLAEEKNQASQAVDDSVAVDVIITEPALEQIETKPQDRREEAGAILSPAQQAIANMPDAVV